MDDGMPMTVVGADTGGTFTDLVVIDAAGRLSVRKIPSTPDDPSRAVMDGLHAAGVAGPFDLVHGTTVATNSLLERRGARTALLTTQGCRDVLEIARQTRPELYSLSPCPRNPLIPRPLRFEAEERLDSLGRIVTPLDPATVERALDAMAAAGVESLAICFLFSFLRPEHEQEAGRHARAHGFHVSLSCEVAPEYREYERTSTVCANAFVAPVMARYIERLSRRAANAGCQRLSIMQSSGGTLRAEEAAASAVKTVLSGPAGGLVAAVRVAQEAGIQRIMTFDMGGTSTDVSLIDRDPTVMRTGEIGGMPLLTPMLDIHTIGAGGGSIARIDAGGGLRVGPHSAGADPGPVAYGRGDDLTVTDANVLLGRLPGRVWLAGSVPLDVDRVRVRFEPFASRLGLSPEQAAEGILAVVNAQMARALRHVSVERGRDPATYTLVSYGGAGGLHACALAEAVGIGRIMVPRYPGAFSALGLALADVRREYARSVFVRALESEQSTLDAAAQDLARRALREVAEEGVDRAAIHARTFVQARYVGQSYSLAVPYGGSASRAAGAFHRAHRARYGHADPSQPVEFIAIQVSVLGSRNRPSLIGGVVAPGVHHKPERVWIGGTWTECPIVDRSAIGPGSSLDGPAVIIQTDATTFVAPGWSAATADGSNLVITSA